MKDRMIGAKVFLLMMAALLLSVFSFQWIGYLNNTFLMYPFVLLMRCLALIFPVSHGDAGMGMAFFIVIIAYYLQILLIVTCVYWLIKWFVCNFQWSRKRQPPDTKE